MWNVLASPRPCVLWMMPSRLAWNLSVVGCDETRVFQPFFPMTPRGFAKGYLVGDKWFGSFLQRHTSEESSPYHVATVYEKWLVNKGMYSRDPLETGWSSLPWSCIDVFFVSFEMNLDDGVTMTTRSPPWQQAAPLGHLSRPQLKQLSVKTRGVGKTYRKQRFA